MNFLVAAAAFAGSKVVFVVSAHLRRQTGYVVPPARQNLSYDWINALLTHGGSKSATNNTDYSRIGSSASAWDANSKRLQNKPPRRARALSASLRAISG